MFYSKIFFSFYCVLFCYSSTRTCKPLMGKVARRSRLFSFFFSLSHTHFSLNHPLIVHVERIYTLSIRLFNQHKHAFLFNNSRCRRNKKSQREHRRFWNTRTAKKETEDAAMRTRTIRYFQPLQPFGLLPSSDARFFFCICSLTENERERRRSHPFSELVVAFYCNRNLFSFFLFFFFFRVCSHITFLDHHHHHHRALLTLLSSVFFSSLTYMLYYVKSTTCYNFEHASLVCRLDD